MQTALRALPAAIFGKAPYGAVPTTASLSAVTRGSIAAAQRDSWRPLAATLLVPGAPAPEAGLALAARSFCAWQGGQPLAPTPRRTLSTSPPVTPVAMPRPPPPARP